MFVRKKRSGKYEYLQIVHNRRENGNVRQRVLGTLGRRDVLVASGKIDGLLRSLARFSEKLRIVEAVRSTGLEARRACQWGPSLVFGRLWEKQDIHRILRKLARGRRFTFDVERVAFAMALQRLCSPGSDLAGVGWIDTVEAPGFESISLQHLYRTAGFLAEVKEELESDLFLQDRDLFTQTLDLVFVDTTSLYVYRKEETGMCRRGYSRDRRGDLPQFVLCVAVNDKGWPVAWEIFPGNTADQEVFRDMMAVLRERFHIRRITVVADRGMISRGTIKLLTEHDEAPFDYVLGCRMRRQKEVSNEVLSRSGRYRRVDENLEVKEVIIGKRRYVVCRNPIEAKKDAADREAIVEKLESILSRRGPKSLIGNSGFARFLKTSKGSVSIDREAVRRDARMDGKFVLVTNTDIPAHEVAKTYKSLWRVERTFREQKSTLNVRPIYHHRDDTSIGHIVASFLALRLEVDMQRRLEEKGIEVSWQSLMRDLGQFQSVIIDLDGKRYRLRTDMIGTAHHAFTASGVRPPSTVTCLGHSPPKEYLSKEPDM